MYKILNQCILINNMMANHMKKLPKYSGFRTRLYIPLVFSSSATCLRVFLPEVPFGVYPIVSPLINCPSKPTNKQPISKEIE